MKRGTAGHPKVFLLAEQLAIPPAHAVGLLFSLFEWCPTYALSGYFGRWTPTDIARGAGWVGDPERFVQALIDSRWVDEVPASAIASTARYGPADDPLGFLATTATGIGQKFATGYAAADSPTPLTNRPEIRQRRHLVVHDVVAHAEDWWRKRVARAGYTWWNGAPARGKRGRPPKNPKRDANVENGRKSGQPVACSPEPESGSRKPASEKKTQRPPAQEARAGVCAPGSESENRNARPEPDRTIPEQLRLAWNECAPNLIPAGTGWPKLRLKAALDRLRERPSITEWRDIFRRMNASPFLRGQNEHRWRADLDFAVKPDTVLHVLEGRYDVPPVAPESPLIEEARRRIAARMAR
jgi:hypothetical protein